jgi:hypothetical protein
MFFAPFQSSTSFVNMIQFWKRTESASKRMRYKNWRVGEYYNASNQGKFHDEDASHLNSAEGHSITAQSGQLLCQIRFGGISPVVP